MGRLWPNPDDPKEPKWLPEDTALAIALHEQEKAEEAERCSRCGFPKAVCRDIGNQFRFGTEVEQCHAMAAIEAASKKFGDEAGASRLIWSAYLRH